MTPFQIGDRVEATKTAYTSGLFKQKTRPVRGVVTGFGRLNKYPLVRVDGRKTSERYHPCFWTRMRSLAWGATLGAFAARGPLRP